MPENKILFNYDTTDIKISTTSTTTPTTTTTTPTTTSTTTTTTTTTNTLSLLACAVIPASYMFSNMTKLHWCIFCMDNVHRVNISF